MLDDSDNIIENRITVDEVVEDIVRKVGELEDYFIGKDVKTLYKRKPIAQFNIQCLHTTSKYNLSDTKNAAKNAKSPLACNKYERLP